MKIGGNYTELPQLSAGDTILFKELPDDPSDNKSKWIKQESESSVYVLGAVGAPGRYAFNTSLDFLDLLSAADGPTTVADIKHIRITHRNKKYAKSTNLDLDLYFETGEGPKFKKVVRTEADVAALPVVNTASDLSYVTKAVSTIRHELNGRVPLIGFSGSPWTLATYMVEGGSSKDFRRTKQMAYNQPEVMHRLLDTLAESVIAYLNGQIAAGAQVVQIFDTWGGALSHNAYQEFSLRYLEKIVQGLTRENDGREVPVILFTKGGGQWLESMAATGAHCLGLDWTTDVGAARARVGGQVALQGNMDPTMLYASPARIREEVATILQSYGPGEGHIFNLGHGITPEVDPAHAGAFIEAVHELSGVYHQQK